MECINKKQPVIIIADDELALPPSVDSINRMFAYIAKPLGISNFDNCIKIFGDPKKAEAYIISGKTDIALAFVDYTFITQDWKCDHGLQLLHATIKHHPAAKKFWISGTPAPDWRTFKTEKVPKNTLYQDLANIEQFKSSFSPEIQKQNAKVVQAITDVFEKYKEWQQEQLPSPVGAGLGVLSNTKLAPYPAMA